MSSSSGGWTHPAAPETPASLAGGPEAPRSLPGRHTVLMSVRVSVCHSGIRPLCLPGAGDESLRLQLGMDPGKSGEFRLSLQDCAGAARSVSVAEFDLRAVNYEVKSPKCHELSLAAPPHDRISFNFRCEQEAREWATVVVSSLREARRVAESLPAADAQPHLEDLGLCNTATLQHTEDVCAELTRAIGAGNMEAAAACSTALARLRVALEIQPAVQNPEHTEVNLTVVVEDSTSSCCFTMKVFPHATTAALKQQVFLEYGFHPRVQRWVIGQCLCADQRSLASYGVRRHGDTAFLYLLTARDARLTPQLLQQDQESALLLRPPAPAASLPAAANGALSQSCRPFSTLPLRLGSPPAPGPGVPVPGALGLGAPGGVDRGRVERVAEIRDLIHLAMPQLGEALSPNRPPSSQGWSCPSCTYINKPTRPGCEICSSGRPESYVVPGGYRPDPLELRRIQQEKDAVRQYQQEKGRREELRSAGAQNNSLLYNLDQDC